MCTNWANITAKSLHLRFFISRHLKDKFFFIEIGYNSIIMVVFFLFLSLSQKIPNRTKEMCDCRKQAWRFNLETIYSYWKQLAETMQLPTRTLLSYDNSFFLWFEMIFIHSFRHWLPKFPRIKFTQVSQGRSNFIKPLKPSETMNRLHSNNDIPNNWKMTIYPFERYRLKTPHKSMLMFNWMNRCRAEVWEPAMRKFLLRKINEKHEKQIHF